MAGAVDQRSVFDGRFQHLDPAFQFLDRLSASSTLALAEAAVSSRLMPDHVPIRQRTRPAAVQPIRPLALASDPIPITVQVPAVPLLSLANWRSGSSACCGTVCKRTAARSSADESLRSCLDSPAPSPVAVAITRLTIDVAAVLVRAAAMGSHRDRHGDDERQAGCGDEFHASPLPERDRKIHFRKRESREHPQK